MREYGSKIAVLNTWYLELGRLKKQFFTTKEHKEKKRISMPEKC